MLCSTGIRIIVWIYLLNITVRGQVPGPNAVALISGQTTLDCTMTDLTFSNWRRSPNGNSNYSLIANGCGPVTGNNAAYYKTDLLGGNICRLTIANVTMQQAGVYLCSSGGPQNYQSLVTVIDPVASIVVYNRSEVVEGDQLNISCSVNYNGPASPAPSMYPLPYWTTAPGQIFINITFHLSSNVASVIATATVQKPTVPIFQCYTVFEITGGNANYNSTPPPDNLPVGSTNEFDVQYGPSTPVISSRPEIIAINGVSCGISVLTCSSTGNPTPNHRWFDTTEHDILSSNDTLTLAEGNRDYKCEVYNTIRNFTHSASANYTVSEGSCGPTSTAKCCVYPHDETTSVTVEGCENGTLCDCSQGSSGIILTCHANTFPNASYMWTDPEANVIYSSILDSVKMNGTHHCVAYFSESLTNYTGDAKFPNGTNETTVGQCSNLVSSRAPSIDLTSTTIPGDSDNTTEGDNNHEAAIIAGTVIGVYVIANVVAMCLFFWYYKKVEVSHSGTSIRRNKLKLDRRFTWLKKMMPCVSDTKESVGSNCLWVSLFILLGTVTGIVTFPIWIILANNYEKNNETSALNKRENGDGNGSGENGRRPANISSANHSQPPSTNQMNAIRREDPYQNESSKENIELNNSSLRSRNLLLPVSPQPRPPPAGRPPPPPNKPTMNSPGRSKDYTANEQAHAANPEHTTYADLPFVERNTLPTATPVQFLNVANDTYAELNKT